MTLSKQLRRERRVASTLAWVEDIGAVALGLLFIITIAIIIL